MLSEEQMKAFEGVEDFHNDDYFKYIFKLILILKFLIHNLFYLH